MNQADLVQMLELSRRKTNELIDAIAKNPDPAAVLRWRPGPGRAHIAWQLMHIAATDDRHLNVRMQAGEPAAPDFISRFAGGSTPDDDVPSLDAIRAYLSERREAMLDHLQSLRDADLATKPSEQAPWTYEEWFRVLAWHEAHHHGQAHLTYNLYRSANDPAAPKVGH
jgi:uncharacterized damage-inducible protein DinB